ncbi:sigma factor-like helix-turn-helix DNA-binding protein [Nocardia gipuzkoensis]
MAVARDSLRLALIACLQHLNGRQRAVLLLRDVLGLPAAEVADLLDTSTAAVKSTLQRARARLAEVSSAAEQAVASSDPGQRALLEEYLIAFRRADPAAIERLLHRDAVLEMPPSGIWFAGKKTCVDYLAQQVLGSPGEWMLFPVAANGQLAAVAYHRESGCDYRAFGVAVLTTTQDSIIRITAFGDPDLVTAFDSPRCSG